MNDAKSDSFLMLKDGRKLGYQVIGDRQGEPLYFFHGTPGSRVVLCDDDAIAKIPGVKIVIPERPGYGISTPKPDRTICQWADDVKELADALDHPDFSVSGSSGGAPYALACGARLNGRVSRVLLLNSAAPVNFKGATRGMSFGNRVGVYTSRFAPWLLKRLIAISASACKKSPEQYVKALKKDLPPSDREQLEQDDFVEAIVRDIDEAYRNGFVGHVSDAHLAYGKQGWGFEFSEVTVPVYVWHGELDPLAPIQTVKRMVGQLPDCHTTYLPEGGHLLIDYPLVVEEISRVLGQA